MIGERDRQCGAAEEASSAPVVVRRRQPIDNSLDRRPDRLDPGVDQRLDARRRQHRPERRPAKRRHQPQAKRNLEDAPCRRSVPRGPRRRRLGLRFSRFGRPRRLLEATLEGSLHRPRVVRAHVVFGLVGVFAVWGRRAGNWTLRHGRRRLHAWARGMGGTPKLTLEARRRASARPLGRTRSAMAEQVSKVWPRQRPRTQGFKSRRHAGVRLGGWPHALERRSAFSSRRPDHPKFLLTKS